MKPIQLSPKTLTLIHRIAGILGGLSAGFVLFLFALYACIHMALPLPSFLLISIAGFVAGLILAFVFPRMASWSFLFLLFFCWNYMVMNSDGQGDEKAFAPSSPPVLSPAAFYLGLSCLVTAFLIPNPWLLLAAVVLVAQYPLAVVYCVRSAERRCS